MNFGVWEVSRYGVGGEVECSLKKKNHKRKFTYWGIIFNTEGISRWQDYGVVFVFFYQWVKRNFICNTMYFTYFICNTMYYSHSKQKL